MTEKLTKLCCYKLPYWAASDPEAVWQLVQQHSGLVEIRDQGLYLFWIPPKYCCVLVLAFPLLRAAPELDRV
jgi:hypothetical protein